MFGSRRDDMTADPENGGVIRLRPAAGEDDLFGLRAEHRGDGAARVVEHPPGVLAKLVNARRVAEHLGP